MESGEKGGKAGSNMICKRFGNILYDFCKGRILFLSCQNIERCGQEIDFVDFVDKK